MSTHVVPRTVSRTGLEPSRWDDPSAMRQERERAVNKDDMILISVDDHIIEPPDMFKNHLPAKYRDEAPRLVHNPDGVGYLAVPRHGDPECGVERGGGPAQGGVRAGAPGAR